MGNYLYQPFILLALFAFVGCVSEDPKLGRISDRISFITQLGQVTQFVSGANTGTEYCEDVVVDRYENIICAGSTNGKLAEDPASAGSQDAHIVKLDKDGNLLWAFQLGSVTNLNDNTGDDYCSGLAVDDDGNIYCAGDASTMLAPSMTYGTGGGKDAFIMKLNPEGQLQWIRQFGSAADDVCNGLTIGNNGDLYCAGHTTGSLGKRVSDGVTPETWSGGKDAFIAKFGPNGSLTWITQIGNNSRAVWPDGSTTAFPTADESCHGVKVDASEQYVYCVGATASSLGDANNVGVNDFDIFFLRLNAADGKNPRAIQYGEIAVSGANNSNGNDLCRKLVIDRYGDLYCTGYTSSPMSDTLNGAKDIVVAKVYKNFTQGPVWQFGSTKWSLGDSSGDDEGRDITVDRNNHLVIGALTSGDLGETHNGVAGTNDAVLLKITTNGVPLWVTQFGAETIGAGATGNETCNGVAVDSDNNIYCSGQTTSSFAETPGGFSDILVLRTNPNGQL